MIMLILNLAPPAGVWYGRFQKVGIRKDGKLSYMLSLIQLIGRGYDVSNCEDFKRAHAKAVVLRVLHDQKEILT